MKVEQNIILNKLFDAYGGLLSKGQKEIMSSYLAFDLTVSEIAENLGISRQAVKDSISKAEKRLQQIEQELGLAGRIEQLEKENEKLKQQLSNKGE